MCLNWSTSFHAHCRHQIWIANPTESAVFWINVTILGSYRHMQCVKPKTKAQYYRPWISFHNSWIWSLLMRDSTAVFHRAHFFPLSTQNGKCKIRNTVGAWASKQYDVPHNVFGACSSISIWCFQCVWPFNELVNSRHCGQQCVLLGHSDLWTPKLN